MSDINARRWNQLIDAVNNGIPKNQLAPPVSGEYENKVYDDMVRELAEMRNVDPKAAFWSVETDW